MEEKTKEIYESVTEPELRICDAHHHLWNFKDNRYLTDDLLRDIGKQKVVNTVCVEAWGRNLRNGGPLNNPAEQTALAVVDSAKNKHGTQVAAGIVGYVDLMEGDGVTKTIEAHLAAGQGRLRGIRVAPESIFSDTRFIEGFRQVIKYKLAVEAVFIDQQIMELKALANRFPDVPIVIDHLGFVTLRHPGFRFTTKDVNEFFRSWGKMIDSLKECPNLFVKLGGIGMDLAGVGWNKPTKPSSTELAAIMKLWFGHCCEKFGPQRCMFEGNFPVDKKSFSYTVYWNAAKCFSKPYSKSERDALFFGTAAKIYQLE